MSARALRIPTTHPDVTGDTACQLPKGVELNPIEFPGVVIATLPGLMLSTPAVKVVCVAESGAVGSHFVEDPGVIFQLFVDATAGGIDEDVTVSWCAIPSGRRCICWSVGHMTVMMVGVADGIC